MGKEFRVKVVGPKMFLEGIKSPRGNPIEILSQETESLLREETGKQGKLDVRHQGLFAILCIEADHAKPNSLIKTEGLFIEMVMHDLSANLPCACRISQWLVENRKLVQDVFQNLGLTYPADHLPFEVLIEAVALHLNSLDIPQRTVFYTLMGAGGSLVLALAHSLELLSLEECFSHLPRLKEDQESNFANLAVYRKSLETYLSLKNQKASITTALRQAA